MPPKRGSKRKSEIANDDGKTAAPALRNVRGDFSGWVEMAYFNIMLKDMGTQGIRVQEVYSLEDGMLAILPRPVHALIFLFRYRETDSKERDQGTCPKQVWFANQTPDFACATFALLNIVNNIPGLTVGKDLSDFKESTKDMTPLQRGDAVDNFKFVKSIHNSFAHETDILQAEVAMKEKVAKFKKRQSQAKAHATREAKKQAKSKDSTVEDGGNEEDEKDIPASSTPTRKSTRGRNPKKLVDEDPEEDFTPVTKSQKETKEDDAPTFSSTLFAAPATADEGTPMRKSGCAKNSPQPTNGEAADSNLAVQEILANSNEQSFKNVRRSTRTPKPRKKNLTETNETSTPADRDDDGFHFIALMPINGHVYRLDGLNRHPQDMGSFEGIGDWMHIAQPELMGRMQQYEGADIEFNLMAVVHDPLSLDRRALIENIKIIQAYEKKLDEVYGDWRELEGGETRTGTITGMSAELDITLCDIAAASLPQDTANKIAKTELLDLIDQRCAITKLQPMVRAAVRDAMEAAKNDQEKADARRRDLRPFVRGWLGELAEVGELLEGRVL